MKLAVLNPLGQQVAVLIDDERTAGKYTVTWFPTKLVNGIYFYRLQAKGVAITRRMLLVR